VRPCRREIPLLQQLQRDHGAEGFQVIGIAVDFRDKVLAYADDMKIDYPLLIGEQDALDAAAAFGVPTVGFRSRCSATPGPGGHHPFRELTARKRISFWTR